MSKISELTPQKLMHPVGKNPEHLRQPQPFMIDRSFKRAKFILEPNPIIKTNLYCMQCTIVLCSR